MDNSQANVRRVLVIGGSILMIVMAYGSGMRARTKQIQTQYEEVKTYMQDARIAQLTAQACNAQVHQLEARRQLDVARDALTKGDAAGAKAAVSEAVTRLRTAQKADAATTADFSGLTDDLANVDFGNPNGAKMALDGFAATMDQKFASQSDLPKPDDLTSVTVRPPTANDKPTIGNDVTRTE